MNSKNRKKYLLPAAVLLIGFLCVVSYFIFCPVRTLGEVLEKKGVDIFTDTYERKDYETIHIFPIAWSGLKNDILGIKENFSLEHGFYFSSPNDKDELCKLLSSLKVRKKLGKYHSSSKTHFTENGYEYWISFYWKTPLDFQLCQQEVCFETNPSERYGSFQFNTYYLADCPENKEILNS